MTSGRFITLEGGEGAGKSTAMAAVARSLADRGLDVLQTREPGGTPLSEALRGLLLDPDHPDMSPRAELLMVFAAREQHLAEVIRPALAAGRWVLCDRFTDASFAYQGGGRGVDRDALRWLEEWIHGDLQPDLTLLLDVDPEVGLERATRNRAADRFERQSAAFYARIREAYLDRARRHPGRIRVIDAGRPQAEVERDLLAVLSDCVGSWT